MSQQQACGPGAVCTSELWQVSPAPAAVPYERHVLGLALSCREQAGFGELEAAGLLLHQGCFWDESGDFHGFLHRQWAPVSPKARAASGVLSHMGFAPAAAPALSPPVPGLGSPLCPPPLPPPPSQQLGLQAQPVFVAVTVFLGRTSQSENPPFWGKRRGSAPPSPHNNQAQGTAGGDKDKAQCPRQAVGLGRGAGEARLAGGRGVSPRPSLPGRT